MALTRPRSLKAEFLAAACVPSASVLAALGLWDGLGRPGGWAGLLGIPVLGSAWAWVWVSAVAVRLRMGLDAVDEAARILAAGRFEGLSFPAQAGPLGPTAELLGRAATALDARERATRFFGQEVEPAQGVPWLEAMAGPAETRPVAALAARWLDSDIHLAALDPAARLGALARFYECVLEAVRRDGGTVLELGGGGVLAVWGAAGPAPAAPPLGAALHAAWQLHSRLSVLSSQHRLRHRGPLDWSLAVGLGPAVSGGWGPRSRRRWAVSGAPIAEVRSLGAKPGGPWLGGGLAAGIGPPYAIGTVDGLSVLVNGPE